MTSARFRTPCGLFQLLIGSSAIAAGPIAQQAFLKSPSPEAHDLLGWSVAVSGDTAVAGAWLHDDTGAAFVFVRTGSTWSQQAILKASNQGVVDRFGWSVAISGDTIVVGAPKEDSNATGVNGNQTTDFKQDSGAAYVFVRSGTTWSQQAYLKASNTDTYDEFGTSVSISNDTVVVGSPYERSAATGVNGNQGNDLLGAGAAYVFQRNGTTWTQQAYVKASNTGQDDEFGESVSVSGDTLVVGAHWEDSNATGVNGDQANNNGWNYGAAYAFHRIGSTWTQQAYLKAPTPGGGSFGRAVSVSDDTIVVGWSSAAVVLFRSGTTWSHQAVLSASNPGPTYDGFADSVAVSGDIVVVGSRVEDSDATGVNGNQFNENMPDSGATYLYYRQGINWTQQAYLKASYAQSGMTLGYSVGISGDTVVVGAPYESSNAAGINGNPTLGTTVHSGASFAFIVPPDSDGDGVLHDNCPLIANPTQTDSDSDFVGNDCDNCPSFVNPLQVDLDADGLGNGCDNCFAVANVDQTDTDGDGVGEACDNCPSLVNAGQANLDGDGLGDACDSDIDGDGVDNVSDDCPLASPCVPSLATGQPRSDLNQDCVVNGPDIKMLLDCILGAGTCGGVDTDGDGVTAEADTTDDLAAFIAHAIARSAAPCN